MVKRFTVSPDVLLVEATGKVGAAVRRSLERRGLVVSVSEVPIDHPFFPQYVAESGAKMVLPVFHPEKLARIADRLPREVIVPVESVQKLELLDNKLKASALAAGLGIRQPRIYDNIEELSGYPVVFKRAEGLGGAGVYFPKNRTALERLLATSGRKGAIVMDFIEGNDYSVDALRWGDFFYAAAYKVVLPRRKGTSYLRRSVCFPELLAIAEQLLASVDFQGVCGFDFRVDREGNAYFLECNPRFSGGVKTMMACGFDQPYLYWCLASGLEVNAQDIAFRVGKYSIDSQAERSSGSRSSSRAGSAR